MTPDVTRVVGPSLSPSVAHEDPNDDRCVAIPIVVNALNRKIADTTSELTAQQRIRLSIVVAELKVAGRDRVIRVSDLDDSARACLEEHAPEAIFDGQRAAAASLMAEVISQRPLVADVGVEIAARTTATSVVSGLEVGLLPSRGPRALTWISSASGPDGKDVRLTATDRQTLEAMFDLGVLICNETVASPTTPEIRVGESAVETSRIALVEETDRLMQVLEALPTRSIAALKRDPEITLLADRICDLAGGPTRAHRYESVLSALEDARLGLFDEGSRLFTYRMTGQDPRGTVLEMDLGIYLVTVLAQLLRQMWHGDEAGRLAQKAIPAMTSLYAGDAADEILALATQVAKGIESVALTDVHRDELTQSSAQVLSLLERQQIDLEHVWLSPVPWSPAPEDPDQPDRRFRVHAPQEEWPEIQEQLQAFIGSLEDEDPKRVEITRLFSELVDDDSNESWPIDRAARLTDTDREQVDDIVSTLQTCLGPDAPHEIMRLLTGGEVPTYGVWLTATDRRRLWMELRRRSLRLSAPGRAVRQYDVENDWHRLFESPCHDQAAIAHEPARLAEAARFRPISDLLFDLAHAYEPKDAVLSTGSGPGLHDGPRVMHVTVAKADWAEFAEYLVDAMRKSDRVPERFRSDLVEELRERGTFFGCPLELHDSIYRDTEKTPFHLIEN